MKTYRNAWIALAWVVMLASPMPARGQKFRPDDPVRVDPDQQPVARPNPVGELSQIVDFLQNTFQNRAKGAIVPAENINTLGEVPDSSWFTNRMGLQVMTIEDLVRGPDQGAGPDTSRGWVIISAKTQGVTPGFQIRDGRGDVYFIKFDPLTNPQMATSSEVICTKLFHAMGYNVPENYLAFVRQDDIRIDPQAQVKDETGRDRPMNEKDVDNIFSRVALRMDGSVQVVASRGLPGEPMGPYLYRGVRGDDPNDIFPHENRRELRGLRLFAAWLNHDDSRSINSGTFFISQGDKGYLKHYLMDFGSCLGSGSVRIQGRRAGYEYKIEWTPILRAALSLGLWDRKWRHIPYPDFPSIGRFEARNFEPELWRPEYPNQAFERMRNDDAFWAVRILMRFTDEMIRAVVKTGRYDDKAAEEYLIQTLIKRRDKIVHHYLAEINPLDSFRVTDSPSGAALAFTNLGEQAGVAGAGAYAYQWFRFDNRSEKSDPIGAPQSVSSASIPVPRDDAPYLMVRISTTAKECPKWKKSLDVFIRQSPEKQIVGIERTP